MHNSKGLTLVEVLVCTFIALIIFAIGFSLLSGSTKAIKQSKAKLQASSSSATFFRVLRHDLNGAYGSGGKDNIQKTDTVLGQYLEFRTTTDYRPKPEDSETPTGTRVPPEYQEVRYYLASGNLYREASTREFPAGQITPDYSSMFLTDIQALKTETAPNGDLSVMLKINDQAFWSKFELPEGL